MDISSLYYIDDSLFEAESAPICENHTECFVNLITKLGFFINKEKSVMIPTKRIKYLGHLIDSEDFKVYLPGE